VAVIERLKSRGDMEADPIDPRIGIDCPLVSIAMKLMLAVGLKHWRLADLVCLTKMIGLVYG